MTDLNPEIQKLLGQVRDLALNYEDTEEYFPWRDRAFFRELKGRNFLFLKEYADKLEVTLRLPVGEWERSISQPFVETNKYMGYKGWITAKISHQTELDQIKEWIDLSYQISKPFRDKTDYLPSESAEILDLFEQVRQLALDYDNIEEYFPYGDRAFRKQKGKIFLYADERGEYVHVAVRLPMGIREHALSQPFVEIPKYIGHSGWVAAKIKTQAELDMVLPWVHVSYDMNQPVRKTKTKKQ